MKSIRLPFLLLCLATTATAQNSNNTLRGKVLYQSSGNKPAVGVRIAEPDATAVFSVDNGDYQLKFQNKRNGASLALEVGKDDGKGQKLELVNEKEVKAAKLPASSEEPLDIIVCAAGQRDIAAQKYYRILRTTADRELERKKKEVTALLEQKEKDYQKISDLFALIDKMQAALDSAKIREQALNIASINLDRASQMVKGAVKKIDEENDVEGALKILNAEALDTAYEHASALKKQADAAIRQVIEGYEFKISLLEPQFKYGEVAECYEKIAEICEREDYDKEELATCFNQAGVYLGFNGDYQEALKFHSAAVAVREKNLPADHPHLGVSYSNLAFTYGELADYIKALDFNLKALIILEKSLPPDHPDLAALHNNRALTYRNLGDNQNALAFDLKALSIREKSLPPDHLDLAQSHNNLAATYSKLGEHQKALEYNSKALGIREKVLPVDHPSLAQSYNNLSETYGDLGEYQKAMEFNEKALVILKKTLPANHPDLAASYNNLAQKHGKLGNYKKQLEFNLKAVGVWEIILPSDHPSLAISYSNLAVMYNNLGEHQKALEFNLKALSIREKVLPLDHPDLARSYGILAQTYGNLSEYQKALEFNLKALAIQEKALPSNHPDLATSYSILAFTYGSLCNFQKQLEFNLKAVSIREKALPLDHPDLATSYNNLAVTYSNLGEHQKALEFHLKALAIREKTLPTDHPSLASSYNNMGRAYRDIGKYDKGIEYGQKAIRMGEASNPKHTSLNLFYANLGITYIKARQYPEAKAALEKSESLKEEERVYRGWAMYYASQKQKKQAIESLQKAISLGFKDLKWLETELDLKNIRKEKGYKELVEQLKKEKKG